MRVAVLGGGRSSEHEVSLRSAAAVATGLRELGHDVVEIEIDRQGRWWCEGESVSFTPGQSLLASDVVFPALHGPYGEDGTVQGLLETLAVPYVGCDVLASAVCMDKLTFKGLLAVAGLPQVEYRAVLEYHWENDRETVLDGLVSLGLPVFVKPSRLGSSVGIAKATTEAELVAAIESALRHDERVIVEALAAGVEVECSLLGNEEAIASQPGEIVIEAEWYDYAAKYEPGAMELVVPARISGAARERVRELAVAAYTEAGCSGMARADFFVDADEVLISELNTMPGFTATSVFAKLFAASGLGYGELLERLLALALERHERQQTHLG